MIRFNYSNEDIKNKEKKGIRTYTAPNIKRVITLNTRCATLNWHTGCLGESERVDSI
jgi:hypothetical protein